ncbi:MAG: competence type IV pilus major pilin ComGC [Acidaminococcaceae bacterium]
MKFFKNKKGFTLVELVVVIAILGILAGIAIPRFMDATASARGAKIVADMRTMESAATMYYMKKGSYTDISIQALVTEKLLADAPVAPTGNAIIAESKNATYKTSFPIPGSYAVAADTNDSTLVNITIGGVSLATLLNS